MNLPNHTKKNFLRLAALLAGVFALPVAKAAQIVIGRITYEITVYTPLPNSPLSDIQKVLEQQPWWSPARNAATATAAASQVGDAIKSSINQQAYVTPVGSTGLLFAYYAQANGEIVNTMKVGSVVVGALSNASRSLQYAIARARPTVSNVRAVQRAGTKLVDITYDLAHAPEITSTVRVEVSQDGGTTYAIVPSLTGAGTLDLGVREGINKVVVWNAGRDWSAAQFSNVRVRVTADDGMVRIPAGTFTMGDTKGEGSDDERPTHTVTLSSFYLQRLEVTYAQWKEIVDWNTSGNRGYDFTAGQRGASGTAPFGALADTAVNNAHPVTQISWWDAVKWCNAKSRKEGIAPCYFTDASFSTELKSGAPTTVYVNWSAVGYRLPTEAEWEYAARGGLEGKSYPWGDGIALSQANYWSGNGPLRGTTPVGYYDGNQTPAGVDMKNGYGLYDLAGNVWEWTWDRYYATYPSAAQTDPRGPASVVAGFNGRIFRGGGWSDGLFRHRPGSYIVRVAFRGGIDPGFRSGDTGFRPARSSVP